MLLSGKGTPCNWKAANEYLLRAAEQGQKNAYFLAGMAVGIGGYGLKRDAALAAIYLEKAAAVDEDAEAVQMLTLLRSRRGAFGAKEVARPPIPWK
jgi:TPR repeat protein